MAIQQAAWITSDPLKVLFEDNHLIAVCKPPGILVQADASGAVSLLDLTREYIRKKYRKPGRVFLGLIHRLDRPVSGVVLFARTSKAAARLSEQFRSRGVEKIYWALVLGTPVPSSGTLTCFIKKGEKKVTLVKEEEAAKQQAVLEYSTIRSAKHKSLLAITLLTGRKHQIRAQLGGVGHPVEGDVKYGAPFGLPDRSIRLMAKSLTFQHPTREERITIEAPPPPWL